MPARLAQVGGADGQPSNLFRDFDCAGPPGLLLLRNPDGGPLCDSFVHLLGAEHWPDRHAGEPRGIGTQLGGCCGDFIGVVDNRVGGGRAVIEIPKFELASDRLDKLGNTCFEGRGRLLL